MSLTKAICTEQTVFCQSSIGYSDNCLYWYRFLAGSKKKGAEAAKKKGKKATKCDACVGKKGGPACVSACPTGAAMRIGPNQFIDLVEERRR